MTFELDSRDELDPVESWRPPESHGLLALDIDGTIVDDTGVLHPAVVDAVAVVLAAGVRVVLATGRSPWSRVAELARELGLHGPQVTMHGALILDPEDGEVLLARALAPPLYLETIRLADELGIDPVVGIADGFRAERLPEWIGTLSACREEGRSFSYVENLTRLADAPPFRVFLPTGPARHLAVRGTLVDRLGTRATVTWADSSGVEVLAPGVDKGNAIEWLASSMALPMTRVAAVGDASNDIAMLLRAGRSAAMATAPDEVRRAADIIVPPVELHGVIAALRWFYPGLASALDAVSSRHQVPQLEPVDARREHAFA